MPSLALTALDSLPCEFRRLIDLYLSHAKRENLPPQAYTWRGITMMNTRIHADRLTETDKLN